MSCGWYSFRCLRSHVAFKAEKTLFGKLEKFCATIIYLYFITLLEVKVLMLQIVSYEKPITGTPRQIPNIP